MNFSKLVGIQKKKTEKNVVYLSLIKQLLVQSKKANQALRIEEPLDLITCIKIMGTKLICACECMYVSMFGYVSVLSLNMLTNQLLEFGVWCCFIYCGLYPKVQCVL